MVIGIAGLAVLAWYVIGADQLPRKVRIEQIGRTQRVKLRTKADEPVYALELQFKGQLDGEVRMDIWLPGAQKKIEKTFKAGPIDDQHETDWIYPEVWIDYQPIDKINEGNLLIQYRFVKN